MMHIYYNLLIDRCKDLGVLMNVPNKSFVDYQGFAVAGYFTSIGEPTIAFPYGDDHAMFHESQHMEQWKANCKPWRDSWVTPFIHSEDLIMLWVDGKVELDVGQLLPLINKAVAVELDCDKRAARLIKKLNKEFPENKINVDEYIQKANAYIMFWHMVKLRRNWYSIDKRPFELPEVWKQFPTRFNLNYNWITNEYSNLFDEHCY